MSNISENCEKHCEIRRTFPTLESQIEIIIAIMQRENLAPGVCDQCRNTLTKIKVLLGN